MNNQSINSSKYLSILRGVWKSYHQHRQHLHNIHIKCASYQAYCWNMAMSLVPELQIQKSGPSGKMTESGIHFGLFQKHQNLAMN